MGRSLKIKQTEEGPKYKIWSSITGKDLTEDWLDRNGIIKFLFWSKFDDFIQKFMEDAVSFPFGWSEKGKSFKRISENSNQHSEFNNFLLECFDEEYFGKFIELLNQYDIKLDVNDGKSQVTNINDTISIDNVTDFIVDLNDHTGFPSPSDYVDEDIAKKNIKEALLKFKNER